MGLDALRDQGGGRGDHGGGLRAVGGLLLVRTGRDQLVTEPGDEAVDHRTGEDREQDDGEARDDGRERVGTVLGGERSRDAQDDHDDGLDHDDGDHDAGPAPDMSPHVLVDQAGVDDRTEQRAHVEQRGPDHQLQPQHAGGQHGHQRHDDEHDRSAADVGALLQGLGERAEERVGLCAGALGDDLGDAVGRRDDRIEDEGGERGREHRQPQEPHRLADRLGQRHPAHRPLGHGQQPQHERQHGRGGEDDGVLAQERPVGEVHL
ncbi:hypothetical protein KGS77_14465 [Streptomyces sp. MST-110588]|nr:hypothetical protein KGS77_14465 [Streptomyces sp. MST-110588]